jgi:hypothetical protein
MMRTFLTLAGSLCLVLCLVSATASASDLPEVFWTHAVNACAIDESDVEVANVSSNSLSHRSPRIGRLLARCNVETLPITFQPGEILELELVYTDQDGPGTAYSVSATLLRITNSGAVSTVETVNSNTRPGSTSFQTLTVPFIHFFDFNSNAYYVEVRILRFDVVQTPAAAIVRIIGLPPPED